MSYSNKISTETIRIKLEKSSNYVDFHLIGGGSIKENTFDGIFIGKSPVFSVRPKTGFTHEKCFEICVPGYSVDYYKGYYYHE